MGDNKQIHSKVVGVTKENDDGHNRQSIIRKYVKEGEILLLERESENRFDTNAIAVFAAPLDPIDYDDKIGYLSSELAAELAPLLDTGYRITCVVTDKTGGRAGESLGVNILLTIFTPEEVAEYNKNKQQINPIPASTDQSVKIGQKNKNLKWVFILAGIFLLCLMAVCLAGLISNGIPGK